MEPFGPEGRKGTASKGWLLDLDEAPVPYARAWAFQRELLRARQEGSVPDLLMLLEHPPVITIGRSGSPLHVIATQQKLASLGVEVFEVERGGSATYHAPGQLVGYPVVGLAPLREDVAAYMHALEESVIRTLLVFGIRGTRAKGYPGVWVDGAKICAVGVAIKRKVTMHGFALNVHPDTSGFSLIDPCGLGRPVTSMSEVLGRRVEMRPVRVEYPKQFGRLFRVEMERVSLERVEALLRGSDGEPAGTR